MEHFKRGDVVYVPLPYEQYVGNEPTEEQQTSKERPVIILFRSKSSSASNSFVICPITSNRYGENKIILNVVDLDSGKHSLGYNPSYIKVDFLYTISADNIRRKIGTLKPEKLTEVVGKVKSLLDQEPEEPVAAKSLERPKKRIR